MAVAVDKELREKAKAEKLYLVQVSVDRRYVTKGGGGWVITGAFTKDMADELRDLYHKWAKAGKL